MKIEIPRPAVKTWGGPIGEAVTTYYLKEKFETQEPSSKQVKHYIYPSQGKGEVVRSRWAFMRFLVLQSSCLMMAPIGAKLLAAEKPF